MRVKMFKEHYLPYLENKVNEFLSSGDYLKIIDIKFASQGNGFFSDNVY